MFYRIVIIILSFAVVSCNTKDCFESEGAIIQQEITVANFSKIKVGNEITLIIKQGTQQKVVIETGENLINDINVEVIDDKLYMEDNNSCNLTRPYAVTKIIVTSPNITEIRSDTSRKISSDGILEYPSLRLISEDNSEDSLNIGDFDLEISNISLSIVANGSSIFKIKGESTNLSVGFYSGSSRFEGENLIAENVLIIQKSTNDMLVNPQQKIEGTIYNLGDVISYHQPEIIDVTQHYTGQLIFN